MEIRINKILCPVDFSENAAHALQYAIAFANAYQAELELLHVLEPSLLPSYTTGGVPDMTLPPIEQIKEERRAELQKLVDEKTKVCPRIAGRLVVGTPFLEIITAAKEGKSDLIVIGTHGKTGLKHMLIGSVAEKVVRKAPCPVLSIKHPEHEFVMP